MTLGDNSTAFMLKVLLFGGLAVGAFVAIRRAADNLSGSLPGIINSAQAIGNAVNPTSPENLAYRGASAAVSLATGDDVPLGVKIWEWINPGTVKAENVAIGGSTPNPEQLLVNTGSDFSLFGETAGATFKDTPGGAAVYVRRRF